MSKRCRYTVGYYSTAYNTARFSDYADALDFCRARGGEMWDASGLIAQFRDGKPTPEFKHLDEVPT